jgi:hypothetical protein
MKSLKTILWSEKDIIVFSYINRIAYFLFESDMSPIINLRNLLQNQYISVIINQIYESYNV